MNPKRFIHGVLALLLTCGTGVSASAIEASDTCSAEAAGAASAVDDWEQVNSNGFGDPQAGEVTALEAFHGQLYAGTHNPIDPEPLYDGTQILRSPDGVTWTPVTQPGFGNTHDIAPPAVLDFVVFNDRLYAGTGRGNAGQIWRSLNGSIWAPMTVTGFGDPDNVDIAAFAVYGGMIYAGVGNQATGAQIWRSFTGDNNTWTQVAPIAPGTDAAGITGLAEFNGALYAAVESESPVQVWRSYGGALGTWQILVDDGFGDADTLRSGGMAVFGGYLFVGAGNEASGAELYRTGDGTIWEQAIASGFGDPNNRQVDLVYVFENQLYVGMENAVTGIEIWHTVDGTSWEQVSQDGFGDGNNTATNGKNATGELANRLYVGTSNIVDGGELWRQLNAPCSIDVTREGVDTLVRFTPQSSAFDLAVGYLSDLLADNDFSQATCLGSSAGGPAVDTLPEPPVGDARYYLARGLAACLAAGYGDSSFDPDPRDDLDSSPCP